MLSIKLHTTAQSGPAILVILCHSLCMSACILESFNDWGGRGCQKYVPVLGGDGTKIATPGDIFDQPSGEMR